MENIKMPEMIKEPELTHEVLLCDNNGNLNKEAIGWSRNPLHTCNLKGHWPRKKRWNYWCVTNDKYLFSVTLSDVDYMGLPFIYILDFETGEFAEKTILSPFGKGCDLGEQVRDTVDYRGKDMQIAMTYLNERVHIEAVCNDLAGKTLKADLWVTIPDGHETLNVVIPWSDKRFQFTSKQNTLPAQGTIQWGEKLIQFEPQTAFACLDLGRGMWPFSCFWNWSSFSTRLKDGRTVGVNLGAGWTDGTGMNENGLCIDGHLIKLSEDMVFEYSTGDFKAPWHLKTSVTDRVDLVFTPFFERVAKTDALIIRSEVHQMIGRFAGRLKTDEGEEILIDNAIGWAEDHHARW